MSADLEDKKRQAEESLRRSQEQLANQRLQEEELRKQLRVDPEEAERRALHMRMQRDRLLAMKKAERDRKVQEEEERKAKAGDEMQRLPPGFKDEFLRARCKAAKKQKGGAARVATPFPQSSRQQWRKHVETRCAWLWREE
jgi:hypothetical protein